MEKDVVIRVKLNGLDSCSDDSLQIYRKIVKINEEFTSICNNLDWDIQSAGGIRTTANKLTNSMNDNEQSLANLRVYLRKADEIYRELDGIEVELKDLDESGDIDASEINSLEDLMEWVSDVFGWLDIADDLWETLEKGFKTLENGPSVSWLSIVSTISGNLSEYAEGNMSTERLVAEIIVESIFDSLLSYGVKYVAAAIVAATIGTGGAALVVVAVATPAVVWAINYATEKATGDDLVEFTSDLVLDQLAKVWPALGEGATATTSSEASWIEQGEPLDVVLAK